MRIFFISFLSFCCLKLFCSEVDYLTISSGVFDFLRTKHRTEELCIEYKPSFNFKRLRPIFGVKATFKGSFYLLSGLSLEFFFNKNLYFSPNLAAGYYFKNSGKNLGFPLEFRSGIELGWQFENYYRVSSRISHLSNAHLGNRNPGCESLVISLSIPLKKYK